MMTDLLGDLWRAGHVGLDFADERVILTEDIRRPGGREMASAACPARRSATSPAADDAGHAVWVLTPVGGLGRAPNRGL